ncbi:MAG: N4-gp56 family major capsid protein [Ruminococcus sp.]|nr:N4-gp56 family major capsid protein [Ruminococcus sp.]
MSVTKIADLIDAEVMADAISGKIASSIVVTPFAKIDTSLQASNAGDTITVPQFSYIGDAEDVAEGVACGTVALTATTTTAKVKKAMKAVTITDEAVLSGYGDPVGQANMQLTRSIAAKVDADCMAALQTAQLEYDGSAKAISYSGIVEAVDVFREEFNSNKVIFINPAQVVALRKDSEFLAADKLAESVRVTGAIGKICNCEVVVSKKVPLNEEGTCYVCPIVKLNEDSETEDESPALTIYMKRNVNVETERDTLARSTTISVDEIYTAALSNSSKVVLATFKK